MITKGMKVTIKSIYSIQEIKHNVWLYKWSTKASNNSRELSTISQICCYVTQDKAHRILYNVPRNFQTNELSLSGTVQ